MLHEGGIFSDKLFVCVTFSDPPPSHILFRQIDSIAGTTGGVCWHSYLGDGFRVSLQCVRPLKEISSGLPQCMTSLTGYSFSGLIRWRILIVYFYSELVP